MLAIYEQAQHSGVGDAHPLLAPPLPPNYLGLSLTTESHWYVDCVLLFPIGTLDWGARYPFLFPICHHLLFYSLKNEALFVVHHGIVEDSAMT